MSDQKETCMFEMKPYIINGEISNKGLHCNGTCLPNKLTRIGLTEELIENKWSKIEVRFYD